MTSCDALRLADVSQARLAEPLQCPRLDQCSIHRHPFFQDLRDEDLALLCQKSRVQTLRAGAMLCQEGDAAERFYIVLSGSLKLLRISGQGNERVLGSVHTDEVLGEVPACSTEGRYPWYAQCLEPTRVRSFSGALLRDMVAGRSDYMKSVMRYVASAMSQTLDERALLTAQSARERLVQYLLGLIPDNDCRTTGIVLQLPLPKGLLASQLAMQPETLSRMLKDLRERGLIDVARREVTIIERAGLYEFMG